ncbi:MAG TPA: DNA polymerase IV [Mycobacteriales bacterium]|nr:DNA polymerase IV [Mycobacteriales bacterium]
MRAEPSVLHLDLDAFYASVEQRDKPSLAGRPVVVGGTGPRGVVATASYEARAYGVGSAMSTAEARRRCPRAAVLSPRFAAYKAASSVVMDLLRALSPLVEPLSLDEAYVDLAGGEHADLSADGVRRLAERLRADVRGATGLVASVGAGTSKLVAKLASDMDKPDGLHVVPPGTELDLLAPLPVGRLWGVGPRTAARLRAAGLTTVADVRRQAERDVVDLLGQAAGTSVWQLAQARDTRRVEPDRDAKSVSAEDTFERDVVEPAALRALLDTLSSRVASRLRADGLSGRTVTVKVRAHDFSTLSRSATLRGPTDDVRVVARVARRLLGEVDTTGGVRLLGVGVTGLTDWTQDDLFDDADDAAEHAVVDAPVHPAPSAPSWRPGQDVVHAEHGRGWVQGSGSGRVTVRLETRTSGPGRVRTFAVDDPALAPAEPEPYPPSPRSGD